MCHQQSSCSPLRSSDRLCFARLDRPISRLAASRHHCTSQSRHLVSRRSSQGASRHSQSSALRHPSAPSRVEGEARNCATEDFHPFISNFRVASAAGWRPGGAAGVNRIPYLQSGQQPATAVAPAAIALAATSVSARAVSSDSLVIIDWPLKSNGSFRSRSDGRGSSSLEGQPP